MELLTFVWGVHGSDLSSCTLGSTLPVSPKFMFSRTSGYTLLEIDVSS